MYYFPFDEEGPSFITSPQKALGPGHLPPPSKQARGHGRTTAPQTDAEVFITMLMLLGVIGLAEIQRSLNA